MGFLATAFDAEIHGGQLVPSDHNWEDGNTPEFIILHGTAAGLQQTAYDVGHDFQTTNPDSVHYAVGRAGDWAQITRERDAAWGNGVMSGPSGVSRPLDTSAPHDAFFDAWQAKVNNLNRCTISIEHVNNADTATERGNSTPLSAAQSATSFALVADICRRTGIPPRLADAQGGVSFHYAIDPVHRAFCPGTYPVDQLLAYLDAHSMRQLPRVESMSEFHGYFGDCTQTAHLACLNNFDPVRWPFTAAELNALVQSDVSHGWADPSGAQTLAGLANSLRNEGLPFHQIEGNQTAMLAELDKWGGVKPIMLGFNLGGKLPGDEPGVQGHAISCLAWDYRAHTGLFCDGDNNHATAPVPYTLAQIQAAALDSMTVFDVVPKGGSLVASSAPVSTDNTAGLGAGIKSYVEAHGITAPCVTGGEIQTNDPRFPGEAFAGFADGTVVYYTRAMGTRGDRGGYLVLELWQELTGARQANTKLQAQADAAVAAQAAIQKQLDAANAKIADLEKQLANPPAPTPTPTPTPAPSLNDAAIAALAAALTKVQVRQALMAAPSASASVAAIPHS